MFFNIGEIYVKNIDNKKQKKYTKLKGGENMEYLQKILKKSGYASIVESIIFAILGIVLIIKPEETVKLISYILGVGFILVGIYKIINYIQMKGKDDLYNYNLIYGVMAIVIGLIAIIYSSTIGAIFRIIVGIWIIYSSVVRASASLKLRTLKSNIWIYTLIISILMFICGLYIALNEGTIVVTIGILMLVYAVMDIIENIIFLRNVKKIN